MDRIPPDRRSANMAAIRSRDTSLELAVRRYLYAAGLRYRIHRKGLPGRPDLVFPSRRLCVFVHGCFWHGCPRCVDGTRLVKSNTFYWGQKIVGNRQRDARHQAALEAAGWTILVFWECQAKDPAALAALAALITRMPPAKALKSAPSLAADSLAISRTM